MKHILFTGAAGYIGSHTAVAFLQNSDCKITIIDNLQSGFRENVAFLERDFKARIDFLQIAKQANSLKLTNDHLSIQ